MKASAPLNRRSENICIKAVVILELGLRNVERQIFAAHLVVAPNDAALEDAPEAFNGLCIHCADDILMLGMVNSAGREAKAEVPVTNPLIGANQTNFVRHCFIDEILQCLLLHGRNRASDHVTLARNSTRDDCLTGCSRTGLFVSFFLFGIVFNIADVSLV